MGIPRGLGPRKCGTCWITVGSPLDCRCGSRPQKSAWGCSGEHICPAWPHLGPSWAVLGQTWANLGSTWSLLEVTWDQLSRTWDQFGRTWSHIGTSLVKENLKNQNFPQGFQAFLLCRPSCKIGTNKLKNKNARIPSHRAPLELSRRSFGSKSRCASFWHHYNVDYSSRDRLFIDYSSRDQLFVDYWRKNQRIHQITNNLWKNQIIHQKANNSPKNQ